MILGWIAVLQSLGHVLVETLNIWRKILLLNQGLDRVGDLSFYLSSMAHIFLDLLLHAKMALTVGLWKLLNLNFDGLGEVWVGISLSTFKIRTLLSFS